jgi:hypothetical protein
MKRLPFLILAFALAVSIGSAETKFSLQLGGGLNYSTGGDLGRALRGQSDFLRDEYGVSSGFDVPLWGFQFAGEIVYRLNSRWGVGFGVGYFEHLKESQVSYTYGFIDAVEAVKPKYAVIPLTANLHYYLPLGRNLRLDLSGGTGYYIARLNYEASQTLSLLGFGGKDVYTFEGSKGGFGLQGGVGLEMNLTPRFSLFLQVLGRYASISGFSGDWTEIGSGDFWAFEESGSGHGVWAYEWMPGTKSYSQLMFQDEIPTGEAVKNARAAKIEILGFSVLLGFKIGLF